jgi:hypothetical protein
LAGQGVRRSPRLADGVDDVGDRQRQS